MKYKNKGDIVFILLIIVMVFLIFFLYFQIADYFSITEKKEIYARVIVGGQYGFDINGTALIFGVVLPGAGATKEIFLDNKYGRDVKVKIFVKGDIKKFIRVSENDFVLEKDENRKITFFVTIPKDAGYRVYEGMVVIIIKK